CTGDHRLSGRGARSVDPADPFPDAAHLPHPHKATARRDVPPHRVARRPRTGARQPALLRARPEILEDLEALAAGEVDQIARGAGAVRQAMILGDHARNADGRLPALDECPEQVLDLGARCALYDSNLLHPERLMPGPPTVKRYIRAAITVPCHFSPPLQRSTNGHAARETRPHRPARLQPLPRHHDLRLAM